MMMPAGNGRLLIIVRHAEAYKTVAAVHGGDGTSLTDQGRKDCGAIGQYLRDSCSVTSGARLLGSSVCQVAETGEELGLHLELPFIPDERWRGMNMGVVAGLSDEEATERYPEAMARLSAWRQGHLDVAQIQIPGAETLDVFLTRVRGALDDAFEAGNQTVVVVGTRSVGIALLNIMLSESELSGKPYTRYRLDPGSVTTLSFAQVGAGQLVDLNRSDFLGRAMDYPDD